MQNNSLLNVEKNKGCNIDITVVNNQTDALSLDSINNNYKDITKIEDLFTDRLDVGTDILTKNYCLSNFKKILKLFQSLTVKKLALKQVQKQMMHIKNFQYT